MNLCRPASLFLLLILLLTTESALAGANVFVYHRFGNPRYPSTDISPSVFTQQLELLRDEKYQVLTLGEVVNRLRSGRPLPEKCAVLTVDDAFDSFYSVALPLLRQFGFPATLFVNTDGVGGSGYMGWRQLREAVAAGIELGNHSAAHDYLVERLAGEDEKAWLGRVEGDLRRAQSAFKDNLGVEPQLFAYPYGEYTPELQQLVAALGFSAAATQQSGVVDVQSDRYALPRFPMGGPFATLSGFRTKLRMAALQVDVVSPDGPVAEHNPPTLQIRTIDPDVDWERVNCFVDGRAGCVLTRDDAGDLLTITATEPLSGRRGKFTLTAPHRQTGRWHWFSQLWIFLQRDGVH